MEFPNGSATLTHCLLMGCLDDSLDKSPPEVLPALI